MTRRSNRHGSGLQTAFEEKTDFFLLTDLPWAILHGAAIGAIQEWIAVRLQAAFKANDGARAYEVYAVLFYVMLFVDDAAGASINDKLYHAQGRPITVLDELGRVVHQTRAQMHYAAAIGVLFAFGHDESAGKCVPPAFVRVFLGVTEDVTARLLYPTAEKRRRTPPIAAKRPADRNPNAEA